MSEQRPEKTTAWYLLSPEETTAQLGVDTGRGLDSATATQRLEQLGPNELQEGKQRTVAEMIVEQLTQPLVLILLLAALVSALLGKYDSVIAIMAIVILNAILGVVQEFRAEQAMAALKKMAAPLVRVRRGGEVISLASRELVPGDVVILEAGNIIPADARVIESANMRVQEASLTGESYPVDKGVMALKGENLPLGDRKNMVYMGTAVSYGRGAAVIVETGMRTELGRIATLIQGVGNSKSPLQKRMDELGKILFVAAFIVMGVAFVVGLIAGDPVEDILVAAVAIAVAVVPEGLPAVVTISLALGAQRMLSRNALIRKLPAVETLGSVTVICSDKTGTLTENKMRVTVIDVAGKNPLQIEMTRFGDKKVETQVMHAVTTAPAKIFTLTAGALCSDANLKIVGDEITADGDPTEGSIVAMAAHFGLPKTRLEQTFPRVAEVPFSSERKRMTTLHHVGALGIGGGGVAVMPETSVIALESELKDYLDSLNMPYVAFVKGASDGLATISSHVWVEDRAEPMTPELLARIEKSNNNMAQNGLRVLGIAMKPLPELPADVDENIENNLTFVGMVGIIDPPRAEVRDAVAVCRKAKIRPVMITGDHPLTAFAIAKELGIAQEGDRVISGTELANMDEAALQEAVKTVSVYARVSPEHKLNIVKALQANGHIAAMTGDGVNDAPALKQADIGVAMGITGTDVSKEAADMVILDDNFTTIVNAVEEGRTIYDNVRRFIKYLLASNTGELFVLLATQLIAGMGLPLTTLQILWMNLITDGIPALALGVEKREQNAMTRPPYSPQVNILGYGLGRHIIIVGLTLGLSALALGYYAWDTGMEATNGAPAWNTMIFIMLTLSQMGHVLALRSHREPFWKTGLGGNRILVGAVVVTVALQLLAVYLPFFNDLFNTNPLTGEQLALCFLVSFSVFAVVEIEKALVRAGVLSDGTEREYSI